MKRALVAALLCCLLIIPGLARAQEVVVAVDHFPPWKIVNGKTIEGIDIDLTNALLNEIGATATFVPYPWTRSLEMMRGGEVDMLSGVLWREEREAFLHFVEPPYKTKSTKAFYTRETSQDILRYEDLRLITIGVQRGARYFPRFDKDRLLSKQPVPDDTFNFRKLNQNRLDAVISTESQGDYIIATMGLQGRIRKASFRHDVMTPVYFAVSKKSPLANRMQELSNAARRLRDNGTFDKIIRDFFRSLEKQQ